ncbi:division/cell wall cluster transcriptional repressor MraZ [Bacilliculturomica massiliensis]|uniref:division/cell wall cluster transcriptional repressor MraZ n=1 Tax=Bacilliculturomica massiliensis TaxID=1917867 RepID=UPI00102F51E6|nr:division/cell wall cluster transcriptional repressor MraZ [Bacilliculturomica massiliensis]
MLMGEYQNSIDAKGRMIVPSKFRDELGYKCVLTKGLDECLYIYPMEQWMKLQEKLATLPLSDAKARSFVRYFYASAVESEVDKQGRLTIPPGLRTYAHIDKELVTIGVLERVEIWSKQIYESAENGGNLDPNEFAAQMELYKI